MNSDGPAQTDEFIQFYKGGETFNLSPHTIFHTDA